MFYKIKEMISFSSVNYNRSIKIINRFDNYNLSNNHGVESTLYCICFDLCQNKINIILTSRLKDAVCDKTHLNYLITLGLTVD